MTVLTSSGSFFFLFFFLSSAETSSLTVFLLPSCLAALFFCSQALAHTPDYALCLILAPQTTQNLRDRSGISRRVCRAVRYHLQDIKSNECYQSDLHLPCQFFSITFVSKQVYIQPRHAHLRKKNIHTVDPINFSLQCWTFLIQLNFAAITFLITANHFDSFVQLNNTGSAIGLKIEQSILANFKGSM